MAVSPIISSFIQDFSEKNELQGLEQTVQFEHFIAWLKFSSLVHDRLSTPDVVTQGGETSIDAAIVALDRKIFLTADDADSYLASRPTNSVTATLQFIQTTMSGSFERDKLFGFGDAVSELLEPGEPETPQDDYLLEVRNIFEVLKKHAAKLQLNDVNCKLFYCSLGKWDGQVHAEAAKNRTIERINDIEFFSDVSFNLIDRNEIRSLWESINKQQECVLPVVKSFPFPAMPDIKNSIVAIVKARDYVNKAIRDESGNIRSGIFDQNIRDFEGLGNEVNNSIVETLSDQKSRERFGVMNNGVTIVARGVEQAADSFVLRSYQIVNGCQTSNVLERNFDNLTDDVLIQVRLIQTESPDVLNDIVKATNSQTQVPKEQFIANRPLAVEVYQFFNAYPDEAEYRLYFERRRSELATLSGISNTRIFTIKDLAKVVGAIYLEQPHLVAGAPNKSFDNFKEDIFQDEHNPIMYYSAAFALYRFNLLKVSGKLKIPEHRLFWHVLFLSRRLAAGKMPDLKNHKAVQKDCEKLLKKLWNPADALSLFEAAYKHVVDSVESIDRDKLKRASFTQEYISKLHQKNQ